MKVIFSHGKESGPDGHKIRILCRIAQDHGFTAQSLDYRGMASPEARAQRLIESLAMDEEPALLVGSSMGGYVSLVASQSAPVTGLFLMAPAVGMAGYAQHHFDLSGIDTAIVHGWQDTIVPVDNVMAFAREHRATLHMVDSDHRLASAMEFLGQVFRQYCSKMAAATPAK